MLQMASFVLLGVTKQLAVRGRVGRGSPAILLSPLIPTHHIYTNDLYEQSLLKQAMETVHR